MDGDGWKRVRALAAEHERAPFPDCRGDDVDGVDLVLVDSYLAGCVSHFLGTPFKSDEWQASILREVVSDLDRIDGRVPTPWAPYFREAAELARETLRLVERDGRGGQYEPGGVDPFLSRCLIAFIGSVGVLDERSPEERVVEMAGDRGLDVLPLVRAIVAELDTAEPPLNNFASVEEIAQAVVAYLTARHRELSAEAIDAVANSYAFQWK